MDEPSFFDRSRRLTEIDADRLRSSRVAVAGLGNVGGPLAMELALAGVGQIVLIDKGFVAAENLSRGIFMPADAGLPKATTARRRILERVPAVEVDAQVADVRTDVAESLFSTCDAVLIATDSWASRMHVNKWAHALPGRTRIVVSGGMHGLSWDMVSSVPDSGFGCSQCPHGPSIADADEEGGCGISGSPASPLVDASVSFTGQAVASQMALETCSALAGRGPLYAGKMLSFEYASATFSTYVIAPDPDCSGHRRLKEGVDYVVVPMRDMTTRELADQLACRSSITLASQTELVTSKRCRRCGALVNINRPLVSRPHTLASPCSHCGGGTFEFDLHTILPLGSVRLSELGVPPGKNLNAHLGDGRTKLIVRKGD